MNSIYVSLKESTLLKIKIKKMSSFQNYSNIQGCCIKHEQKHIPGFSYFYFFNFATISLLVEAYISNKTIPLNIRNLPFTHGPKAASLDVVLTVGHI